MSGYLYLYRAPDTTRMHDRYRAEDNTRAFSGPLPPVILNPRAATR